MAARIIWLSLLLLLLLCCAATATAQAGIKRPAPSPEQTAWSPEAARKVIRTPRATTYIYVEVPRIFISKKRKKR